MDISAVLLKKPWEILGVISVDLLLIVQREFGMRDGLRTKAE